MPSKKQKDSKAKATSKSKTKLEANSIELELLSTKKTQNKKKGTNSIPRFSTNNKGSKWLNIEDQSKQIRYVAFGDSITAGFNPELGSFSAPGKMDEQGKISGLSYPAFFAHFLKKIDPLLISSFENFGLSGTRIDDWLYILGVEPELYNYENSQVYFKFLQNLDIHPNNPFPHRIQQQFHDFGKMSQQDFDYFHQKLHNASLVTLTLGANDLIWYFFKNCQLITKAVSELKSVDALHPFLETISIQIESKLTKLINKIKEITNLTQPHQINLLSYHLPF